MEPFKYCSTYYEWKPLRKMPTLTQIVCSPFSRIYPHAFKRNVNTFPCLSPHLYYTWTLKLLFKLAALMCTHDMDEADPLVIELESFPESSVVVESPRPWDKMFCRWRFAVEEGYSIKITLLEGTNVSIFIFILIF